MPGHRRSASELRIAGTYRRDRHASRENLTKGAESPLEAPASLSAGARAVWDRVVALPEASHLTEADVVTLMQYAELAAILAEVPRDFTAAQHTALRLLAGELCLTPAARSRVGLEALKQADADNPFARLDE